MEVIMDLDHPLSGPIFIIAGLTLYFAPIWFLTLVGCLFIGIGLSMSYNKWAKDRISAWWKERKAKNESD